MLVLSRNKKQSILIGEQIEITVLTIKEKSVRLGIKAPSQVRVIRKEIKDSQARAGESAK